MSPQHANSAIKWIGAAALAINLCGCTLPSWDDITSREIGVRALWTPTPPPMVVIEKSTDGYARAMAFNKLDEVPDTTEHAQRLKLLQTAATGDRDPLCRIAALRTLGRYKDPQAGKILIDVYLSNPGLSPENNAFIQQQALTSLRTQAPPEAKRFFIEQARQPTGLLTGTAQRDRMEILDARLTSIRALAKYPQPDSIETLVKLLETDKDPAIRKCAHESLVNATKADIPPDGKAWREYVATGKTPPPKGNALFASFMKSEPSQTPSAPQSPPNDDTSSPGLFSGFVNWLRQDPNDPAQQKGAPPSTLPNTLPSSPLPTNQQPTQMITPGNQARTTTVAAPPAASTPLAIPTTPTNRGGVPAGSYRNPQGELIVPASPP